MAEILFAIGLILVVLTSTSVLFTIVLPREPRGFQRLTTMINRTVQVGFLGLSRLARSYEGKDSLLAPAGPVALLAQLGCWALCFIVGYALMLAGAVHSLGTALVQATGALFTVGTIGLAGTRTALSTSLPGAHG